jgi:aspartyl-tRNA(Asn)/glutamyl-tRNA(Gln) amidotransferase subunit A
MNARQRTMSNTELHHLGVAELAAQLRAKQVSATEAAQHFWPAPRRTRTWAPLSPNEDATLAQAKAADALIAEGKGGKLAGVPIAHKDIFVTKDFPTTAASKMLAGYQSPFDATVVRKLADAGVVTLGKLNCDEFAMGGPTRTRPSPRWALTAQPVRNPWDTTACPAARPAARPPPWPRAWRRPPPAPTPAARSASPPRSAASPASSPPTAAPAATA